VHNNLYNGILINNSDNCTICDNNAALGNYGINIEYSINCTIKNNTATDTAYYGIQTYSSNGSKVNNNIVTENDNVGISIQYSMNCTISENIIRNSQDGGGIEISSSNDTQALDNTLDGNYQGIRLWQSNNCRIYSNEINGSLNGIYVYSSNSTKLSYNTMKNNFYGLLLLSSNKSMLTANTLKDSLSYGIWTIDSNGNNLFHNNFVDNQVQIFTAISANIWNSSIEGNYWNDYIGVDQNSDGISDQDYTINENNIDHFPLMGTLFSFNTSSGISIYTISNSTISNFNYEPHTTTIRFTVNGPDGTVGFCRIRIPHKLINGTYYVTIDNVEPDLANYSLYDDGKNRWLYFAYEHSPHEVVIVSEFKSLTIMLLFMIITLLAVTVYERKVTSN